jgi:pimeloyl-ACP methyl ester carboxylesterase
MKLKSKIPIVLLPGLSSDALAWEAITSIFDGYQIKVILLNHDHRPNKLVDYVLNEAPTKFILIGHSLGGWIALELMRIAPERVASLILINTTARPETTKNILYRKSLIDKVVNGNFSQVIEELIPNYVSQDGFLNKLVRENITSSFLRTGAEIFIRQQKTIINRPGSLDVLKKIKCPSFIVHADMDAVMSEDEQHEMFTCIPNANMVTIKNCGHFSFVEKPSDLTNKINHWLSCTNNH